MPPQSITIMEQAPCKAETSLLKSGAHTVSTNVLQVFGVLATTAFIARALGPERKGTYDLYIATSALLTTILGFSFSSGITYVVASRVVDLKKLAALLLVFASAQGLLAWGVLTLLSRFALGRSIIPVQIGSVVNVLIGLTVFVAALSVTFRAVLAGQRRFITANHVDLAKQALSIIFAVGALILALALGVGLLPSLIVANVLAVGMTAAIFFRTISVLPSDSVGRSGFQEACLFSLPCYASTIVQFLNYRLDVFFVNGISGARELGLYQLAVLLCQGINLVPSAAQAVLFPTISAISGVRDNSAVVVAQANRLLTSFGILCACLLGIAGVWGIPLVFGESFTGAVPALLLLIPGCVVFVTSNVIAGYFAGIGKPRLNLYASLAGVALTIPLDILLIPRWGILGAAIASTVSYTATSVVTAIMFSRLTSIPISRMTVLNREDLSFVRKNCQQGWEKLLFLYSNLVKS